MLYIEFIVIRWVGKQSSYISDLRNVLKISGTILDMLLEASAVGKC